MNECRHENEPQGWNVISWEKLRNPPVWFASTAYVLTSLFGLGLFFLIILPTLWRLGWLVAFGTPDAEDLRAALFSVGGIIATPFVIWRIWTSHIASLAAFKQAAISSQSLAYVTFSKSIEQLGLIRDVTTKDLKYSEPNFEARIGAIFSLSELAKNQPQFLIPTIETLAAYIRFHSPKRAQMDESITVDEKSIPYSILSKPTEKLDFNQWIEMEPYVRFDSALALNTLFNLVAMANVNTNVNLIEINLRKIEIEAKLIRNVSFDRSQIEQFHSTSLIVENCQFQWVAARSIHALFTNFSNCFFKQSIFAHAGFDFSTFRECSLIACDYRNASLAGVKFHSSLISGCRFDGSYLNGASFKGSELSSMNFGGVKLVGVSFDFSEMDAIQFHVASSSDFYIQLELAKTEIALLTDATFEGAWLSNVDLSAIEEIQQVVVDKIYFADTDVILPSHLTRPNHWTKLSKYEVGYDQEHETLRASWLKIREKVTGQQAAPRQKLRGLITDNN